jgi:hypothetical protein
VAKNFGVAEGKYGQFSVTEISRPYERKCSWCADKIPRNSSSIVVRLRGKHKAKFCRQECWQSWESIYWQRISLNNAKLAKKAFADEQRSITRQKHFLGYGW